MEAPKTSRLANAGLIVFAVGMLLLTQYRLKDEVPTGYVSPKGMMARRADYNPAPDDRLVPVTLASVKEQPVGRKQPEKLPAVVAALNLSQKQGFAIEGKYVPRRRGGELPRLVGEIERIMKPGDVKRGKPGAIARVNEEYNEVIYRVEVPWNPMLTAGDYILTIVEWRDVIVDGQTTGDFQTIAECNFKIVETDAPVPNRERIAQDEVGE